MNDHAKRWGLKRRQRNLTHVLRRLVEATVYMWCVPGLGSPEFGQMR